MTRGDRIRKMTDDELVAFIEDMAIGMNYTNCESCRFEQGCKELKGVHAYCHDGIKSWLEEETDD